MKNILFSVHFSSNLMVFKKVTYMWYHLTSRAIDHIFVKFYTGNYFSFAPVHVKENSGIEHLWALTWRTRQTCYDVRTFLNLFI